MMAPRRRRSLALLVGGILVLAALGLYLFVQSPWAQDLKSIQPTAVSSSGRLSATVSSGLPFTLLATSSALTALSPTSTPPIAWNPPTVIVTLSPGETKTAEAVATIRNDIPSTEAGLVPALLPYGSVGPSTLSARGAGTTQRFTLSFTVPDGTPFQTIDGTLHLLSGTSTIARPLPITLNIWQQTTTLDGALTISFPPSVTVNALEPAAGTQVITLTLPSGAGLSVEETTVSSSQQSIVEWADAPGWPFPDSWRNHFIVTLVNSSEALQDPTTGSVILKQGEHVFFVDNGLGREDRLLLDKATFDSILETLIIR